MLPKYVTVTKLSLVLTKVVVVRPLPKWVIFPTGTILHD